MSWMRVSVCVNFTVYFTCSCSQIVGNYKSPHEPDTANTITWSDVGNHFPVRYSNHVPDFVFCRGPSKRSL